MDLSKLSEPQPTDIIIFTKHILSNLALGGMPLS